MPSLTGFVATITLAMLLAGEASGQEPRPSDHGLVFQAPPPANSAQEMRSFFNNNKTSSTSTSSASSDTSSGNVTESLPPWRDTSRSGGGRLGRVLLTASLACGITGGILLLVSGLLYLFKHRKRVSESEQNDSFRADDDIFFNNNNTKKLELVRNP